MTLPRLAEVDDLEEWIGSSIAEGSDTTRAERYLSAASSRVRSIAGRTWVGDDDQLEDDIPEDVIGIVLQAAERKWNNPNGVIHDVAGPFSARYSESASEGIYITDEERRILEKYRGTSGVWTLATTRGDTPDTGDYINPGNGTLYVEVEGGEPIPYREVM